MRDNGAGFQLHQFQSSEATPASGSGAKLRVGSGHGFRIVPGHAKVLGADNAAQQGINGFFPVRVKVTAMDGTASSRYVYGSDWQPEEHQGIELETTQPWAPLTTGYGMWALQTCESDRELLRAMAGGANGYGAPQPMSSSATAWKSLTPAGGGYARLDSGLYARREVTIWTDETNGSYFVVSNNIANTTVPNTPITGTGIAFRPGRGVTLAIGANVPLYVAANAPGTDTINCIERGS